MKRVIGLIVCLSALFGFSVFAQATVLDFEDLAGTYYLPDPYPDSRSIVDWEDDVWGALDLDQPPYYPASGQVRICVIPDYSSWEYDTSPSWAFLADVVFEGAYFAGWPEGTVQADLYKDGNLVHSTGTFTPSDVPGFLATDYSGLVDRVVINSPNPGLWVMDDLTYTHAPLPGAIWLLGSGLVGLGILKLRRR